MIGTVLRKYTAAAVPFGLLTLLGVVAPQSIARTEVQVARTAATRVLYVKDEGHLHLNGSESSGQLLVEEGALNGQLPGSVKARLDVASTVTADITVYPRGGGSISAHGKGTAHYSNTYASFSGTVTVNHGTGRYAHAHGSGGFYGVVNRRNDSVILQTTGKLYY